MQQPKSIQLNPIIEATPVPFTMDTLGWKILFFLLFAIVLFIIYKVYKNYQNKQYRREAVSKILQISTTSDIPIPELITNIMFQIKQTALITFGRKKVASLNKINWLHFLDKTGKESQFLNFQQDIFSAIYKEEINVEGNFNKADFVDNSIKWIKSHA